MLAHFFWALCTGSSHLRRHCLSSAGGCFCACSKAEVPYKRYADTCIKIWESPIPEAPLQNYRCEGGVDVREVDVREVDHAFAVIPLYVWLWFVPWRLSRMQTGCGTGEPQCAKYYHVLRHASQARVQCTAVQVVRQCYFSNKCAKYSAA